MTDVLLIVAAVVAFVLFAVFYVAAIIRAGR